MIKHKHHGFTVVELVVVIAVIAVLVSIAVVSYRTSQANARDQKRVADALMLKAAVDEYYSDNGDYPIASPYCTSPGSSIQCWRNEIWQLLVDQGYLTKIPQPELKAWSTTYNVASDGNTNYGWYRSSATSYGIYIPLETSGDCKLGRNMTTSWFGSAAPCDF